MGESEGSFSLSSTNEKTAIMENYLFIKILIISQIVLLCESLHLQQCFYCQKFFHRNSDETCPQDVAKCTTCINGSVIDVDQLDTCLDLNFTLKPSKETRVALGGVLIIPCLLTAKVECQWLHNGQPIDFERHSRYQLKTQTEAYTTDCSLVIHNASLEDAGNWTCTNTPIPHQVNSNYTVAQATHLYVDQPSVIGGDQHYWFLTILIIPVIAVIGLAVYVCRKRRYSHISNDSEINETMNNNSKFTRMPSSPTEIEPKTLNNDDHKSKKGTNG